MSKLDIKIERGIEFDTAKEWFQNIRDVPAVKSLSHGEVWGASVNDSFVGMAVIEPGKQYGVFLDRIAVDPSYRRAGVASLLIRRLHEEYGGIQCEVHTKNSKAVRFFRELNFEEKAAPRRDGISFFIKQ